MGEEQTQKQVSNSVYRRLAEFRYRIRQFLHFSEEAARAVGIEPQQHQLLLVLKGLPSGCRPTVAAISERLCLRHHSTVELVNRLVVRGAVVRRASTEDRREVLVELTAHGEELLRKLSVAHWQALHTSGPALSAALERLLKHAALAKRRSV